MVDWLVVGLGNPDAEYALSPHNIGFMVIDRLAERNRARVTRPESRALAGFCEVSGKKLMLAKPQTYMNLSGGAVKPLLEKNELGPGNLIVVYDDHDLEWLSLRIRKNGSAGGHHGMESVIGSIGTSEFTRVRLGIDPGGTRRAEPAYLLKPMRREQLKELDGFLDYAAQAVESIVSEGAEKAMTRFNRRAQGEKEDE
ncbi:MAG TPA: aminoacyl-tRNA hydrolase [Bryobacteraceae bacterium]|nr:aminoacyl-tRNA hydrolase [Bryobacteraceae bacterium]